MRTLVFLVAISLLDKFKVETIDSVRVIALCLCILQDAFNLSYTTKNGE